VKRRLVRVRVRPGGSARAGAARDARHLKEAEKTGVASHQQARDAMKGRWRHPKKSLGWYRDMKAAFAPAPRGLTRPSTDSTNHENESHMTTTTTSGGFSAQESAAIENRAKELKAQAGDSDGKAGVLSKIHAMPDEDEALATRFRQLVHELAPDLAPRTWYGMPAYATPGRSGKVTCRFQSAEKMKTRYNSIGCTTPPAWTRDRCGRRRSRSCGGTPPS